MQTSALRLIARELRNEKVVRACAEEFAMVGDPTRLKICYLLCRHRELSVGDIARAVGVSISAVSHTLAKLKSARVVQSRRSVRRIYYRLIPSPLTKIIRRQLQLLK